MTAPFHILDADYGRDLERLRAVREPVFVREQQVPIELEWDELDPLSRHVLAVDASDRPIATGRLTPEHKIGRMAVVADWRGRGVGAAVLQRLLAIAREQRLAAVELHAQESAIDFYARCGFQAYGEAFDEAGIRHRHMRLVL